MNRELMAQIRSLISQSGSENGMLSENDVQYLIYLIYSYSNCSFDDLVELTKSLSYSGEI